MFLLPLSSSYRGTAQEDLDSDDDNANDDTGNGISAILEDSSDNDEDNT